jgi:uncharacterized protein
LSAKDLIIRFHEVPPAGLHYEFNQTTGELNAALHHLLGDYPVYGAKLEVQRAGDGGILLRGSVAGEIQHVCSRCVEEFGTKFSKTFVTQYCKQSDDLKTIASPVDDLEGSFDLEFVESSEIRLADVIYEQVAIDVPFQPLCTESCLGLCPECGGNRNRAECKCSAKVDSKEKFDEVKPSPFASLKGLVQFST